MKTDVEKFVKMCEVCQIRTKYPDKKSEVKYIESLEEKERFQVDLVQLSDYLSEEKRYLWNMVDHFSKFADSKIITNKTKETVFSAIKEIFSNMGFPKMLQSDNGTEFKNKLSGDYLQKKR